MSSSARATSSWLRTLVLAARGLRGWTGRQVLVAVAAAAGFALLLGVATVLIPNTVFARDIPPVWWNYPVWILTSVASGMLVATYVAAPRDGTGPAAAVRLPDEAEQAGGALSEAEERRTGRFAVAGGVLAWFAVGCPVCNKLALLALGYAGAITWFAPVQPFLALIALALTAVALVARLRGQVACPLPAVRRKEMAR